MLHPDKDANRRAYGDAATARGVVEGKSPVMMAAASHRFVDAVSGRPTRATTGRK
jgi:hypothetical protein